MTLLLLSIIVVVLDVLCVCPEPVLANHRVSPENSQINRGAVSFRFVVCRYPTRRYGSENEHATAAWEILRTTVYNYGGCGAQHDQTISCVSPSPRDKTINRLAWTFAAAGGFGGYHDGTGVEWKVCENGL